MTDQAQLLPGTLDLLILRAAWHPPTHRADLGQCPVDRTGRALSRSVSARPSGTAQGELGHIGEQSPRQVLRTHRRGPQASPGRDRQLESARGCHRFRALCATGGSMKLLDSIRFIATLFQAEEGLCQPTNESDRSSSATA
jgi:hypothetical protein